MSARPRPERAHRWGLISTNPAQMVDPPAMTRPQIHPLTREEAEQLRNAVLDDRLEARWLIGLLLGLRQGEALGLRWDDVNLATKRLTVIYALQKVDGTARLVAPKTKRSLRTLPMPSGVVDALVRRRDDQRVEREKAQNLWQGNELNLVFTTQAGTPINQRNDYRSFQAILTNNGLRKIRLHDLRHTTASLMLEQGVPARVVMELLGHSQISLTLDTYTHVDERLLDGRGVSPDRAPDRRASR